MSQFGDGFNPWLVAFKIVLVGSPEVQIHVKAKRCDYKTINQISLIRNQAQVLRLTLHEAITHSEILLFCKESRWTQEKRHPMLKFSK